MFNILTTAGSQLSQVLQNSNRPNLAREFPAPGRFQISRSQNQLPLYLKDAEEDHETPACLPGKEEAEGLLKSRVSCWV